MPALHTTFAIRFRNLKIKDFFVPDDSIARFILTDADFEAVDRVFWTNPLYKPLREAL